jgi:hypothetical protein
MRATGIRMGVAAPWAVLLLAVSGEVAAQAYHPAALERFEQAPAHILALSASAFRALDHQRDSDLRSLDAFGGKQRTNPSVRSTEKLAPWSLYGRFRLVNFQNDLEAGSSMRFTWRSTGPGLGGAIYVGIHRRY